MRGKAVRMDAGVGAPAAQRFDAFAKQQLQGAVDLRLHGVRIFLPLPAVVGGAVVRYVDEVFDAIVAEARGVALRANAANVTQKFDARGIPPCERHPA